MSNYETTAQEAFVPTEQADKPSTNRTGWFIREGDGWVWTDTKLAAVAALTEGLEVVPVNQKPVSPDTAMGFGAGRFVVDTGSFHQSPAVFICPVDEPGKVGASARSLGHDRYSLQPGERVLTFPTFAQAQAVADALVTPLTGNADTHSVGTERSAVTPTPSGAS